MKRKVYLLCNAHLAPVWLWDRDEGIAEVLSTFRVAADFAEEDGHFVFNHKEMILGERPFGKGRIVISTMDFARLAEHPVGRLLLANITK